jgi:uncharacterized membrane protein YczE
MLVVWLRKYIIGISYEVAATTCMYVSSKLSLCLVALLIMAFGATIFHVLCDYCVEARDRLRKIREEQARLSDEVVELWKDLLVHVSYKLGNEGE